MTAPRSANKRKHLRDGDRKRLHLLAVMAENGSSFRSVIFFGAQNRSTIFHKRHKKAPFFTEKLPLTAWIFNENPRLRGAVLVASRATSAVKSLSRSTSKVARTRIPSYVAHRINGKEAFLCLLKNTIQYIDSERSLLYNI